MTQAKINRQTHLLFNYLHHTPFLIFPQYAPFRNNPQRTTFRNLSYLDILTQLSTQCSPISLHPIKTKKPPASVETLEA